METKLNWKKGFLKETYEIYSDGVLVGTLKENIWKQKAYGELNGQKIIFQTNGFFKQETQIIDPVFNLQIGKITYNSWMTKAAIEYGNKIANWKCDNVLNTRWSIIDSEAIQIHYQGSSLKGSIINQSQDGLLLLTGLYITNHYWQISMVVIIAILIPIITAIH
jgi:hypothetical protein